MALGLGTGLGLARRAQVTTAAPPPDPDELLAGFEADMDFETNASESEGVTILVTNKGTASLSLRAGNGTPAYEADGTTFDGTDDSLDIKNAAGDADAAVSTYKRSTEYCEVLVVKPISSETNDTNGDGNDCIVGDRGSARNWIGIRSTGAIRSGYRNTPSVGYENVEVSVTLNSVFYVLVVWLKDSALRASLNGAAPVEDAEVEEILSLTNNGVIGRNANNNYGNFKIKRWACTKTCPADPQQLSADLATAYGL